MWTNSILALAACGTLAIEQGRQIDLADTFARASCFSMSHSTLAGTTKDIKWTSVEGTNLSFSDVAFDHFTWDQGVLTHGYLRSVSHGHLIFKSIQINEVEFRLAQLAELTLDGSTGGNWRITDSSLGTFDLRSVRAKIIDLTNVRVNDWRLLTADVEDLTIREGHYGTLSADRTNLIRTTFLKTLIDTVKLSGTRVTDWSLRDTTIDRLAWAGGLAENVRIDDSRLGRLSVQNMAWRGGHLNQSEVAALFSTDVSWTGVQVRNAHVAELTVHGGLMSGVVFDDVRVDIAEFERTQFSNADLTGLQTGQVHFVNCTYDQTTRLPPGPIPAGLKLVVGRAHRP